jgi:hypothetical protein
MCMAMNRAQRIKELYRELSKIHEEMKPFVERSVGKHKEWTQEDADLHLKLHRRQGEILKELAKLEDVQID